MSLRLEHHGCVFQSAAISKEDFQEEVSFAPCVPQYGAWQSKLTLGSVTFFFHLPVEDLVRAFALAGRVALDDLDAREAKEEPTDA